MEYHSAVNKNLIMEFASKSMVRNKWLNVATFATQHLIFAGKTIV